MAQTVVLCATTDVSSGEKKRCKTADYDILVVNISGAFFALNNICTHQKAALSAGYLEGHEVECPLHGARFDVRTGEATVLPAVIPVKAYPVTIVDGMVTIPFP